MRRIAIPLIAVLAAAALPAAAGAHVSLHPNEVPTGAYATLDLRVPNESEDADTTKIAVQLPAGFTDVSTWSEDRPTELQEPRAFIATVCLVRHLDPIPEDLRDAFIDAVMERVGEPVRVG